MVIEALEFVQQEPLITEADMNAFAEATGYPGHMGSLAWNRARLVQDHLDYAAPESPLHLRFLASDEDIAARRPASYLCARSLALLIPTMDEAAMNLKGELRSAQHTAIRLGLGPNPVVGPSGVEIVSFLLDVVRDKLPEIEHHVS